MVIQSEVAWLIIWVYAGIPAGEACYRGNYRPRKAVTRTRTIVRTASPPPHQLRNRQSNTRRKQQPELLAGERETEFSWTGF